MIIGISGRKRVGKDEAFNTIANYDPKQEWQNKKYAYKLKKVASILTGFPVEKFEEPGFKKQELPSEWNKEVALDWDQYGETTRVGKEPMTVREFLQKLGTESIRTGLHPQAWINALFADYKPKYRYRTGFNYMLGLPTYKTFDHELPNKEFHEKIFPNWIITDVRFPNEAEAVRKHDGYLIRIERPSLTTNDNHASETSMDSWNDWDAKIINDGSLEEFKKQVINVYENLNINNLKDEKHA